MKKSQVGFGVVILISALFGSLQAQTKVFSEAEGDGRNGSAGFYDSYVFKLSGNNYRIKSSGQGKRASRKGITNFRLKLERDEGLESRIYFTQYKDDLILVCETSIGDGGRGFITRLNGKTLKTKWQRHIPAFNIAKGIIENNSAYLAAIGFVAKINLDTGKYLWEHEDFYRKYKEEGAFNIFETPKIKGNIITFTENQDMYKRPPNIIKFNKNSGKVIEVKVN